MPPKTYKAIGLMSGSSLDGLDIAYCEFQFDNKTLTEWKILEAETVPFSEMWQARLINLPHQNALAFSKTHTYFGHYLGELTNGFIDKHKIKPDLIASHGHTIFHNPDQRLTVQVGDGAALAMVTGFTVINNFRAQDIAIGGEGAPIAPIADKYLFPGFDFYLNLGGIANISCNVNNRFIAFDICSANQTLNALAQELELKYDENGRIAKTGKLIESLFKRINKEDYFHQPYPKSLDNSWVQQHLVAPFIEFGALWEDKLRTATVHLAYQVNYAISKIIEKEKLEKDEFNMIITGGGAFNTFLIDCISRYCKNVEVFLPEEIIINFKEAALMALMGVLRMENIPNTMHTATGAKHDTVGGAVHQGKIVIS